MTEAQASVLEPDKSGSTVSGQDRAQAPINRILERLSTLELPAKEQFANYLRHKSRLNHKRSTLNSSFTSTMFFLDFYGKSGKYDLKDLERTDVEAFIEHEQDRGLKISTVKTRLNNIPKGNQRDESWDLIWFSYRSLLEEPHHKQRHPTKASQEMFLLLY